MKKIVTLVVCLISLFSNTTQAQHCASMEHLKDQLLHDPGMAARRQQMETETNQFVANYHGNPARAIITIPVVIHIVGNASVQAITAAQIQAQMDRLNLDYHKLNTDVGLVPSVWTSLVADYEIQFCLASRDPNGNTTTGIIRKTVTATSFSTNDNVKRTANGGDDAWPAASYLNLWVCNLSGGVLGYAQFPGGAAATDGVVITYTGFGTGGTAQAPYNLGRTATHEIGHWLNLYHIWGDDGSGCNGSDQVNDTPNQGSEHYGCPNFPSVSCSNGPNGDMWMNYMDYTDDACMYMFTNGQKARSLALFNTGGSRVSLLTSQGCQSIATPPVANFTADAVTSCTGIIKFTDLSTNAPTSWAWNFGDGQTSITQNPTHLYAANGTYTVSLTATNSFGSNTKTLTGYITISKPAAPAASDVSHCGSGTFSLSTSSTNPVAWLDSNGVKVSSANPFVTPVLTQTTTYWLQDTVGGTQYHVGKLDNSGSGGYLTQSGSNWALVFNVNTACVLQSVYVYAGAAGNRTFELRNSGGTLLQTLTVNVPNGGSRVTLNFNLPVGTGHKLLLSSASTINLYRNNAGAVYPYNDAGGYVSITGNSATNVPTYYYFFYDWIIQGAGCVSQRKPVTAIVSAGLNATPSVTNATCGSNNGSASVTITGGTPGYTYNWSTGGTGSSISGLTAATYTVTVSDANSCSGTASAVVANSSSLVSTKASTNVTCFGGSNGTASVNVTSGTPNYTYLWSNLANTPVVGNLTAGNYYVTITDGSNCQHVDSFTITQPADMVMQITTNSAHCFGEASGMANASASGGNSGYVFNWSNSTSGASTGNLAAGNYAVTVTDASNCTSSATFIIDEPAAITTNTTFTSISCFGESNATANVIPSGGIGNFTYSWCNGNTTHNASGLSAGVCAVTVTDDNGCSATASVTIQQPAQIQLTTSTTNGSASVDTVTGGAAPFTFVWSNGDTTQTITGVPSGNYVVTVTDNNGCTAAAGVTVLGTGIRSEASEISFSVFPNPASSEIILSLNKANAATSMELKNVLGQSVLSRNISASQTKIDVSSFANGIYFIEVKQGDKKSVKQVVVAK